MRDEHMEIDSSAEETPIPVSAMLSKLLIKVVFTWADQQKQRYTQHAHWTDIVRRKDCYRQQTLAWGLECGSTHLIVQSLPIL